MCAVTYVQCFVCTHLYVCAPLFIYRCRVYIYPYSHPIPFSSNGTRALTRPLSSFTIRLYTCNEKLPFFPVVFRLNLRSLSRCRRSCLQGMGFTYRRLHCQEVRRVWFSLELTLSGIANEWENTIVKKRLKESAEYIKVNSVVRFVRDSSDIVSLPLYVLRSRIYLYIYFQKIHFNMLLYHV